MIWVGRTSGLDVAESTIRALEDALNPEALDNLPTLGRQCHTRKRAVENHARQPVSPEDEAWRQLVAELL